MSESDDPEWLPDEYDRDADLADRLPIMAEIDGGIELHVKGDSGTVEIVGSPQHFNDTPRYMRLCCGSSAGDWSWEIVVPKNDDHNPRLEKVDPDQDIEAYEATKQNYLSDVDVRIYGVDAHRYTAGVSA